MRGRIQSKTRPLKWRYEATPVIGLVSTRGQRCGQPSLRAAAGPTHVTDNASEDMTSFDSIPGAIADSDGRHMRT